MSVNDRLFAPPKADAEKVEARLALLPQHLRLLVERAGAALAKGEFVSAQHALTAALKMAPDQPDTLRLNALMLAQAGDFEGSSAHFEAALRSAPDDAVTYFQYAEVREAMGDVDGASSLRQRAVERLPDSPLAWADLGDHLFQHESIEDALSALDRATRLAPDYAPAQLKYGSALVACGRAKEGAAAVRRALEVEPAFGAAWLQLSDIKTVAITPAETEQMLRLLRGNELDDSERTAVEFALARAYEDSHAYKQAFDLLIDANARRRREQQPWQAAEFVTQEERARQVFNAPHAGAEDSRLGEQVIFIVGMPRSGTTLVEQILASHPLVRGAGELGDLARVITEESTRRKQRYPEWVPSTTARDWQRLGLRYLDLTAKWFADRPRFIDKMPSNWRVIGAIRAMLPGARIIVCRRDPLENCWSCFKQFFPSGWEFTSDFGQLATFWKALDRAASEWAQRSPLHVRQQTYETLVENPEEQARALLEFCGLPFDQSCLRFHDSNRSVRTLSAAQVREPIKKPRDRTQGYGALLDPLRAALGLPPHDGAQGREQSA